MEVQGEVREIERRLVKIESKLSTKSTEIYFVGWDLGDDTEFELTPEEMARIRPGVNLFWRE